MFKCERRVGSPFFVEIISKKAILELHKYTTMAKVSFKTQTGNFPELFPINIFDIEKDKDRKGLLIPVKKVYAMHGVRI
jgi:hypothetical protein